MISPLSIQPDLLAGTSVDVWRDKGITRRQPHFNPFRLAQGTAEPVRYY